MSDIQIKITNLPQIRAAFKKSPRLMKRYLNIAIRKTTLNIQAESLKNTPVDTGRLRASHHSLFGHLRSTVGTNTNYDIFVHEGTKYMEARPYLLQAVNETSNETDEFFTEAVQTVLNQIGKSI